eukprot:COSAG05_NODE_25941_length_192_cov_35.784946_1_plen_37_part_01
MLRIFIFGTVIDKKSMKTLAIAMGTGLSSLLTVLVAI